MKKRGFTLVELLAVMAIMSIVFYIVYSILISGNNTYKTELKLIDVQETGRNTLQFIGSGIKEADTVTILKDAADLSPFTTKSLRITKINLSNGTSYFFILNDKKLYKYYDSSKYSIISSNIKNISITTSNNITYKISADIFNEDEGSFINFSTNASIINRKGF